MIGARIPVGVVGVGALGYHHARVLREIKGARMVGVYDADAARADEVGRELGIRVYHSLDALLAKIEAAVVAVPTTSHAEVALAALDRGVHLLIEKPLAATLEEADRIVEAAARTGAVVATGQIERFNSAVRAAEQWLDEPRFIESHRLAAFGLRGTDVPVVLDLMIHDIDLILGLTHCDVRSVDAVGVPVVTPTVDIANARMVLENGLVANITASRVSQERMRKIRIFQPSGYLSLDLGQGRGEFLRIRPGISLGAIDPTDAWLDQMVERIEIVGDGKEPLRAELGAFVAAARGEADVVVSGEDGRRALAVALDIVQRIDRHVADPRPA